MRGVRGGMLAVLVLAATGCSSPSKTATPAAQVAGPDAWEPGKPSVIRQRCQGILEDDAVFGLQLKDAKGIVFGGGASLWCDAEIGDEARVLRQCKLGDVCLLEGTVVGYGVFGWTRLDRIERVRATSLPPPEPKQPASKPFRLDDAAVSLVGVWNDVTREIGADSLRLSATSGNGYMLGLLIFSLLSGGGFVVFGRFDG